ncbi:MAG TPA: hypothetical protein VEQ41_04185 [Solirubrobacterales bacterium]|nr:hypothetical protein [Solirubrobacterales bacterium]
MAERLAEDWEVELIAPPASMPTGGASGSGGSNAPRRLAAAAVDRALLDKWEPWSVKRLARWQPECDAALLIGHPVSPLVYAARRLAAAGIPYVIDEGDPWILTNPAPYSRGLSLWRGRREERRLWEGAAGGVLTTAQQADRLTALFPGLPTIVRPNGYDPLPEELAGAAAPDRDPSVLRLVHFGMLSSYRLDLGPLLRNLGDSGRWERVVMSQFGDDFAGMLDGPPPSVEIERHPSYPWREAVRHAAESDLALVVGNHNPDQLPSKAVQYSTLPIPRLAVTKGTADDALAAYVSDKPGWLSVAPEDPEAPVRVAQHVAGPWAAESLRPPAGEAWPAVAGAVAAFVERCVAAGRER